MTIPTITQSLTAPTTAPSRTQSKTTFDTNIENRLAWDATNTTELGTVNTQINATVAAINAELPNITAASSSADTATAVANYQGAWSGLTGAGTAGWTVGHNGIIWLLETTIADITAAEPGVSASWTALTGIQMTTRTSNTIITNVDVGKIFQITMGGFSQTFQAVSGLTAGFFCWIWNNSTGLVTLDPDGSETINGATTLILAQGEYAFIWVSGSALYAMVGSRNGGDHVVEVHTGNGHGSTNTSIRRFSTAMTTTGTAITYADSAANGATFTINSAGLYEVAYSDICSGSQYFGVSINSAQLTTSVASITIANRVVYAGFSGTCTRTIRCAVGDVLRPHTDGNPSNSTNLVYMSVRKVSN